MNKRDSGAELPNLMDVVADDGFLRRDERTLVMLSGGGDSVALLDIAAGICGADSVVALHVNYGLRGNASDADEAHCRTLSDRLEVELFVERVSLDLSAGNLQDLARAARYELAERIAEREHCERIAVAHSADDRAETMLHRLFSSPGRRALTGMPRRRGRIVRPLLDFRRQELRDWCRGRDLAWRDDASNDDPRFARVRIRRALAELAQVHPAAIENINRSADELLAEQAALEAIVDRELAAAIEPDGALRVDSLAKLPEAIAALVLREFAERSLGAAVPAARLALPTLIAFADRGGSHTLQIEGAQLELEYGMLRPPSTDLPGAPTDRGGGDPETSVQLPVPGVAEFGHWRFAATSEEPRERTKTVSDFRRDADSPPEQLRIEKSLIDRGLTVRARRGGDRIRLRGAGGSKSLQDLYVDRKLPQRLRSDHPVVLAGEEIVWVPGLAVSGSVRTTQAEGQRDEPVHLLIAARHLH